MVVLALVAIEGRESKLWFAWRLPLALDVRRAVKHELPHVYKSLGRINSWLVKARKKSQENEGPCSEKTPPTELYPLLRAFLNHTERWLSLNRKTSFREQLLELYFTVNSFSRVALSRCANTCAERCMNSMPKSGLDLQSARSCWPSNTTRYRLR